MPSLATDADFQHTANCCIRKETCCQHPSAGAPKLAELYSEFVKNARLTFCRHGTGAQFSKACVAFAHSCRQLAAGQTAAWSKANQQCAQQMIPCHALETGVADGQRQLSATELNNVRRGGDKETRLLEELRKILSHMPPETRRVAIKERLSQRQRRTLEAFMVSRKASEASPPQHCSESAWLTKDTHFSQRSLCACRSRCGQELYRPSLHIQAGLYVHSSQQLEIEEAIAALGVMIALRSLCAFGAADFQERVRKASHDALGLCETSALRLKFRCRAGFSKNCELSTPTRHSVDLALEDWCSLQVFLAGQKQAIRIQQEDIPAWLSMQLIASKASHAHLFVQWRQQVAAVPDHGSSKRMRVGSSRVCSGHSEYRLDAVVSQWSRLLQRTCRQIAGNKRHKVAHNDKRKKLTGIQICSRNKVAFCQKLSGCQPDITLQTLNVQ
mmetsp:Transcript_59539/g.110221  ORF Transcript_59539/g.110221 Transcript_59539/m.110221 type:complete len:443 (+) Transcript_59539:1-1329(+)